MADTWLTPDKEKSLLDYIKQGANEEDLYAAGYTKNDLSKVGWFAPVKINAGPHHPDIGGIRDDSIQSYTPTAREDFKATTQRKANEALISLGLPGETSVKVSRRIAEGLAGTENPTDKSWGSGLVDFTPLGAIFGAQEGVRQTKRGLTSGDKSDVALGALNTGANALAVIPGGKLVGKGFGQIAAKMAENYDPNLLNIFILPTKRVVDEAENLLKRGYSRKEIALQTGAWQDPRGKWFQETDDRGFRVDPKIKFQSSTTGKSLQNTFDQVFPHSELYAEFPQIAKNTAGILTSDEAKKYLGDSDAAYFFGPKRIFLRSLAADDVALHELQHAVDDVSKLDAGADPKKIYADINGLYDNLPIEGKAYLNSLANYLQIKKDYQDVEKALTEPNPVSWLQRLGYTSSSKKAIKDLLVQTEEYSKDVEKTLFTIKEQNPELTDALDGLYEVTKAGKLDENSAYEIYLRNEGESRANLTQARKNLSPYQKAMTDPWPTGEGKTWSQRDLTLAMNKVQSAIDKFRGQTSYATEMLNLPNTSKKAFAEGGTVENIDPISGNSVPPGSLPQEVRDDVEAKLSEGEYVLPADVVRYFGLDYIEKLVNKAKQGLQQLQDQGRVGGKAEDDLPFSAEELMAHDAEMKQSPPINEIQMAEGGFVPDPVGGIVQGGTVVDEATGGINPATGLPWWFQYQTPQMEQPAVKAPTKKHSTSQSSEPLTGLAGNVETWSAKDFITYANTKDSVVNRGIEAGISALVPFGKVAIEARNSYLDKNVPVKLDEMISSGKDPLGNTLSVEDLNALKEAKTKLEASDTEDQTGLFGGIVGKGLKSLFGGSESTPTTPTSGSASTPSQPSTPSTTPAPTTQTQPTTPTLAPTTSVAPPPKPVSEPVISHAERAGFSKGGFIARR